MKPFRYYLKQQIQRCNDDYSIFLVMLIGYKYLKLIANLFFVEINIFSLREDDCFF